MPERSKFTRYKPKITKSHGIRENFFQKLDKRVQMLYNKEVI